MQTESVHFPATPVALKMAVAIGIGMLAGMEREWSNKDVGIRTFAIGALLGMLASLVGQSVAITSLVGVFLLVAAMNARSILADRSLEITTSAALIVNYLLGVLVGLGHIFTPVAGAIVMTMLLAWKTELSCFAGGLQPSEIRSAVLLGPWQTYAGLAALYSSFLLHGCLGLLALLRRRQRWPATRLVRCAGR